MDTHIKTIIAKISALRAETTEYLDALKALQKICQHDWSYEGHGHNDALYVCSKCGKDDYR